MNAQADITNLVRDLLAGTKVDAVRFIDQLLLLADAAGEIRCSPVANEGLRFSISGAAPFEVCLDRAWGKLRMLCARLAVLCEDTAGKTPYGGQGRIIGKENERAVQFINTAAEVSFTLQSRRSSTAAAAAVGQWHANRTDQQTTR